MDRHRGTVLLTLLAVGAAWFANQGRKAARAAEAHARMQLLAIQARRVGAQAHTTDEIELAAALALESIESARKENRPTEVDTVDAARTALIQLPLQVLPSGSPVRSLAVLRDGRLASGGDDGLIKIWPKDGKGSPLIFSHGGRVSAWWCCLTGGW